MALSFAEFNKIMLRKRMETNFMEQKELLPQIYLKRKSDKNSIDLINTAEHILFVC